MEAAARGPGAAGAGRHIRGIRVGFGPADHGDVRGVCKRMDEAAVRAALAGVMGPDGRDLVSGGRVDGIAVRGGMVQVALLAGRAEAPAMERVRAEAERVLRQVRGVVNASVVLTGERTAPAPAHGHGQGHGQGQGHGAPGGERLLANVPVVIAVASGKGGVGKSTVATNLALALAARGRRVGLLDADIYGPSLPRMLGVSGKPEVSGQVMRPIEAFGLKCMSIGFLVAEEQALVWRGPMVMGALQQMLGQTDWGGVDTMVVDLPPGTGDAQLTLSQRVALTGAVIVSTPQDIALIDARRGVAMFGKVGVPVLGIVENMSYFCCPACGARSEVFGHGGARAEAARIGVPFLGEVPLVMEVREAGDAGVPVVAAAPGSGAAVAFEEIATTLLAGIEGRGASPVRFN